MARTKSSLREAFNARYRVNQETGCWEWTGDIAKGGYGRYQLSKYRVGFTDRYVRERIYAHRLSWELHYGQIPEGNEVCHRCDHPPCVNPSHLFLGEHHENMGDRDRKMRQAHGERQGGSRLTEFMVREIMASPESSTYFANRFGVSIVTVSDVRRGKTWTHLGLTRSDDAKDNQKMVGSEQGGAKLKEADIPLIRARLAAGEGCTSIGRSFGVSDAAIRLIRNGKKWTHV